MTRGWGVLVGAAVLAGAAGRPATAQLPEPIRHAAEATVLIEASWEIRGRFEGKELREFVDSNGSGFLIAPQGMILTNSHVVDPQFVEDEVKRVLADIAKWIDFSVRRTGLTVRAFSGSEEEIKRRASVLRTDRKHDLAIVSTHFGRDMPYLRLGLPEQLEVGRGIIVCGFPADSVIRKLVQNPGTTGSAISISQGRVTALRRDNDQVIRLLQVDAAVVGGNSGGPVIDRAGRLMGVLSSTIGPGVNFAIGMDTVMDFASSYVPKADQPGQPDAADAAEQSAGPAANEVILYLKNGDRERGILKRETETHVTLKLPGLGVMQFRKSEIARMEPVAE